MTLLVAGAFVGVNSAAIGAVGASSKAGAAAKSSPLAKGLKYYRGKTITVVAPSNPGASLDTIERLFAPYLATYLQATVNVLDNGEGGGVGGADQVAAAPANGLTIGYFNMASLVQTVASGQPGITFSITKQVLLGSIEAESPYTLVESNAAKCPQITSFNAFLNYNSPTKLTVLTAISGTGPTLAAFALAAFKSDTQTIDSYPNTSSLNTGFTRGDGCFIFSGANSLSSFIKGGVAHALALTAPALPTYAAQYVGVPTFAQLIKQDSSALKDRTEKAAAKALVSFSTGVPNAEFVRRGTPQDEVVALEAAVKSIAHNASFRSAVVASGTRPTYLSPSTDTNDVVFGLKSMKPFTDLLSHT